MRNKNLKYGILKRLINICVCFKEDCFLKKKKTFPIFIFRYVALNFSLLSKFLHIVAKLESIHYSYFLIFGEMKIVWLNKISNNHRYIYISSTMYTCVF